MPIFRNTSLIRANGTDERQRRHLFFEKTKRLVQSGKDHVRSAHAVEAAGGLRSPVSNEFQDVRLAKLDA